MERVHNDGRDKKGIRSYTHSKKEKRNLARLELEKHIESHIEEAIAEKTGKSVLAAQCAWLNTESVRSGGTLPLD